MELFAQVRREICDEEAVFEKGKAVVKSCVNSALGQSFPHRDLVLDELYIFLVVYELLGDIRTRTCEPELPEDLRLPFWPELPSGEDCPDWWNPCGLWVCRTVVPSHGRGRLAKVVLLLHALTVSLSNVNQPTNDYDCCLSRSFDDVSFTYLWKEATDHLGCHPLALQGSLVQLKALSEFIHRTSCENPELDAEAEATMERILPILLQVLSDNTGAGGYEHSQTTEEERLRAMIMLVTPTVDKRPSRVRARNYLATAKNAPLVPYELDSKTCLAGCIGHLEKVVTFEEMFDYCCTDDELGVERLLLFGTKVSPDSLVAKKLKRRRCFVHFGAYR